MRYIFPFGILVLFYSFVFLFGRKKKILARVERNSLGGFMSKGVVFLEIFALYLKGFTLSFRLVLNMSVGHALLSVCSRFFPFYLMIFLFEMLIAVVQAFIFIVISIIDSLYGFRPLNHRLIKKLRGYLILWLVNMILMFFMCWFFWGYLCQLGYAEHFSFFGVIDPFRKLLPLIFFFSRVQAFFCFFIKEKDFSDPIPALSKTVLWQFAFLGGGFLFSLCTFTGKWVVRFLNLFYPLSLIFSFFFLMILVYVIVEYMVDLFFRTLPKKWKDSVLLVLFVIVLFSFVSIFGFLWLWYIFV